MVELLGVAGLDDAQFIGDARQVREHLRQFCAGLAVPRELEARGHDRGVSLDEGVALVFDDIGGDGLAVVLREGGLVIEQVELRGRAGHEEVDDAFGFWREVRVARCEGILGRRRWKMEDGRWRCGGEGSVAEEQRCEGDFADADAALREEVAARYGLANTLHSLVEIGNRQLAIGNLHRHSFVTVSSRFNSVRATVVQAASSFRSASFGLGKASELTTSSAFNDPTWNRFNCCS
jgi:hypothetical protein